MLEPVLGLPGGITRAGDVVEVVENLSHHGVHPGYAIHAGSLWHRDGELRLPGPDRW